MSVMSEPNETGGRPLASTPTQAQQSSGITTQDLTPISSNNQKAPPLSDVQRVRLKAKTPRRRSGQSKQALSGSPVGASHSEHRSTSSPSNMSSPLLPVHYTRTGRVSKAKKGLKVHNCTKCGRSYTRAEHLRRHQRNHAQEQAMSCSFTNCDKTFVRRDLLQRHIERHNEPDRSSETPSTYTPEGSPEAVQPSISMSIHMPPIAVTDSVPNTPFYQSTQPVSPPLDAAPLPRYSQNLFRTPQLPRTPYISSAGFSHVVRSSPTSTSFPNQTKQRGSYAARSSSQIPVAIDAITSGTGGWAEPFSYSPGYSSSSGYTSPLPGPGDYTSAFPQMPYGHGFDRTRASSNASVMDPWSYPSRSPTSTASTMAYWPSNEKTPSASNLVFMGSSFPITSMPMSTCIDPTTSYGSFASRTMMQRDDEEGIILFGEQAYGMGSIAHTYPFEQYLDYFWRLFHPAFPIVHRSTFEHVSVSPMLHAAMIAIGGQHSNDIGVKRKSRILHDRCIKLLERRDQETLAEPDRLCDYQAMFLIEFLSQYRARRGAKVLSSRFAKTYQKAHEDFMRTTPLLHEYMLSVADTANSTPQQWLQWIELASWQRLLIACYVLESQQSLLLAREPIPSLISHSGYDLPFPCHISTWDAADPAAWALTCQQQSEPPQYVYNITPEMIIAPLDSFQSSLLINAYHNRSENLVPYASMVPNFAFEHSLDTSSTTKRQLLTARLVHVTPIRGLLAVSGESWILSQKVPSPQAFESLRTVLRTWIAQLWNTSSHNLPHAPVQSALRLAIEILEHALQEQKDNLLPDVGSDMGIYFAGLVLWAITAAAHAKVSSQKGKAQSVSTERIGNATRRESPVPSTIQPTNLLQRLPLVQQSARSSVHDRDQILSHAQITINTISFLADVLLDYNHVSTSDQFPSTVAHLKRGCISLLLWVKLRLRGITFGGCASATDSSTAKPSNGLGELLDGITGSLERLMGRGWDEWGI